MQRINRGTYVRFGGLWPVRPCSTACSAAISAPRWPAYDGERRASMMLGETSRVEDDPGGETRTLWREIVGAVSAL